MLKDLVFWHSKLRHCLCCWHLILKGQFWFSCLPDVPGKATNDGLNLWALATHMEFQVPRFSLAQQPLEDWTSGWKITSPLSGLKINILKIYMLGNKFSQGSKICVQWKLWNIAQKKKKRITPKLFMGEDLKLLGWQRHSELSTDSLSDIPQS